MSTQETASVQSPPLVHLTPAAVRQVRYLMEKQGDPNLALRLGVKGGGCSGLSYTMTLTRDLTPRDLEFEVDGLRVLVDQKSARFLDGASLDYTTRNLLEGGWQWTNPHARRSCGCGTSFTPG